MYTEAYNVGYSSRYVCVVNFYPPAYYIHVLVTARLTCDYPLVAHWILTADCRDVQESGPNLVFFFSVWTEGNIDAFENTGNYKLTALTIH